MLTVEVRAFKCSVCGELFYGKNAVTKNHTSWHYMQAVVLPEKESKNDIS